MTSITLDGKATQLRNEAQKIASAVRLVNNSDLDLERGSRRVLLSGVALPGFQGHLFEGEAQLCPERGEVLSLGMRRSGNGSATTEFLLQQRQGVTSITERRYESRRATNVACAVFNSEGTLIAYRESVV